MTVDRDNPKLTAFALGELNDAERAQLEAELAADQDAQDEVAQIRELAGLLEAELAAEPTPTLTADQRATVLSAASSPWRKEWLGWAAAAGVGLMIYGGLSQVRDALPEGQYAGAGSETAQTRQVAQDATGSVSADPVQQPGDWGDLPDAVHDSGTPVDPRFRSTEQDGRREVAEGQIAVVGDVFGLTPEETGGLATAPEADPGVGVLPDATGAVPTPVAGPEELPEFVRLNNRTGPVAGPVGKPTYEVQLEDGLNVATTTAAKPQGGEGLIRLPDDAYGASSIDGRVDREKRDALVSLAQVQARDGRWAEAIEAYDRALALDPSAADAYAYRAMVRVQLGDLDAAVDDYGRALTLIQPGQNEAAVVAGLAEASKRGPEALQLYVEQTVNSYRNLVPTNPWMLSADDPLSTFSIDVDTAAYANMRRALTQQHALPALESVRIEELINYFDYGYAPPAAGAEHPFATHVEVAGCPWSPGHRLVRVGLKGYEVQAAARPPSNLVFLLDVSGSMSSERKLPLLKRALAMLVPQLSSKDRVAIVVYAGASGLVLDSTRGDRTEEILGAIERLSSGGSTNGGAGIELAYSVASRNFLEGGINRVILATDGDFNVGVTQRDQLLELIERKAKSKVFLSVLGLGMRRSADATMEQLADHGNGVYSYLDTIREAKKVLVDEMSGTLFTIAKDVKLQLEFNPAKVASYRLIGYENRVLAAQDFNDDTKDAGEIGAGHTVTALYEIVPVGAERVGVDPLRYQPENAQPAVGPQSGELLFLKLRYKQPEGDTSQLLEQPVIDEGRSFAQASQDFRFAAAVAAYGMILRQSSEKGSATLAQVQAIAQENPGLDRHGYRAEFVELVALARKISGK